MKIISVSYSIQLNNLYKNKMIHFLGEKCNLVTYSTILEHFILNDDEYLKAIQDLTKEIQLEDVQRKKKFNEDTQYRKQLLTQYVSLEKVAEYFERLTQYDHVELDTIKSYLSGLLAREQRNQTDYKNTLDRKTVGTIPKESFMESRFTAYSHCTIGGIYKVYTFKMDKKIIHYLEQEIDLMSMNCFQSNAMLEDPAFYKDDRIICSICSHERTCTFYLEEVEYADFLTTNIPIF